MLLAITVLCATPPGAVAAVGQVTPILGRGYDDCLRVTGLPGELVMPAPGGIRFVDATRERLKPGPVLRLADDFECGSVVSRANGAGVIAGAGRQASAVTVSVREPGSGTWGAPVAIALEAEWRPDVVRAAVSDRGDVVVAWRETRSGPAGSIRRVRVARRSPGGAFGPGELLGDVAKGHELVLPAVAATGEAFVLTTTAPDTGTPHHAPLLVWTAAPGAAFGSPTTIGGMRRAHAPALAAAADGRVLVAWSDGAALRVTEREPAGGFGASVRLGAAGGGYGGAAGVALGPAGEAAVGWVQYPRGEVWIASRRAPGAFGRPSRTMTAKPLVRDQGFADALLDLYFGSGITYDEHVPNPVLSADGRATLGWSRPRRAVLTSAPLGGGSAATAIPGRALRNVDAAQALTLADGTPALVWSERMERDRFTLHLAADGVRARPEPAAPRVTFGAPRSTTLSEQEALRLPVTCSGPCVLFAGLGDDATNGEFVTLPRGGRGELKIQAAAFFAPRPAGPVKLTVRYRALDGLRALTRTVRVRIARAADVPHPRITDLRAVRTGGSIRVRWRVAGPIGTDRWPYYVSADATRAANGTPLALRIVEGSERRYAVTLRAGPTARFVTVRTALGTGNAIVRIR